MADRKKINIEIVGVKGLTTFLEKLNLRSDSLSVQSKTNQRKKTLCLYIYSFSFSYFTPAYFKALPPPPVVILKKLNNDFTFLLQSTFTPPFSLASFFLSSFSLTRLQI